MAIDIETVRRIAALARIRLGEDELPAYAEELSGILAWIEQLNEVDTAGVPPASEAAPHRLPLRPDVVTEGGDPSLILANAPEAAHGFFVVPKVVE